MTLMVVKHKNGNIEVRKIKRSTMVDSIIRVERKIISSISNIQILKVSK